MGRLRAMVKRFARRVARSLGLAPTAPTDLGPVWDRIEAMDFGIHEQLAEMRAAQRRELDRLREEVDTLDRRLADLEARDPAAPRSSGSVSP